MANLIQGVQLTSSCLESLLQDVKLRLKQLENEWATKASEEKKVVDLSSGLDNAVFALNGLPDDAASLIVLVTDGVGDLDHEYDGTLMQLCRQNIACHIIQIGTNQPNTSFGYIPDVEVLEFLAETTGGSCYDPESFKETLNTRLEGWNMLQRDFFIRTTTGARTVDISRPLWLEKLFEYKLVADLAQVCRSRLSEGFCIRNLSVIDGLPSSRFLLQWIPNVWIQYIIVTRRTGSKEELSVRIEILAELDFMIYFRESHDDFENHESTARKLHAFICTMQDVDRVLLHLLSASMGSRVPMSLSKSSASALHRSAAGNHVFEIVGELPIAMWSRWFHVERLEIITFRNEWPPDVVEKAHETLQSNFSRWSTQRLADNLLIKYFDEEKYRSSSSAAAPFCLVRVTKEAQTLFAIHVAFFAAPVDLRREVMLQLQRTSIGQTTIGFHSNFSKVRLAAMTVCRRNLTRLLLPPIVMSYFWNRTWKWYVPTNTMMEEMITLLHRARQFDQFWVVDFTPEHDSLVMAREILISDRSSSRVVYPCLLQYRIRQESETQVVLSFHFEPQDGNILSSAYDFHASRVLTLDTQAPQQHVESTGFVHRAIKHTMVNEIAEVKDKASHTSESYDFFRTCREILEQEDRALLSSVYSFSLIQEGVEDKRTLVGVSATNVAEEHLPFSTTRLLCNALRKTEMLPLYLQKGYDELNAENVHLYTMLEQALVALSDCEAAWTDYDGLPITKTTSEHSRGRCFAKIVNPHTILLAFLPAIDQTQRVGPLKDPLKKMNLSAMDDTDIYMQRKLSYREGYKSWRMGGCQGSQDAKRSDDKLFRDTTPYGQDQHAVGFFRVAFYECSRSHFLSKQSVLPLQGVHTVLPESNGAKAWTNDRLLVVSKRFRKKVQRAHQTNFSRGVYLSLREGGNVQTSDLEQALSSCIEIPIDLDITLLSHVERCAVKFNKSTMEADSLLDVRFNEILSKVFLPIGGTKFYYFNGNDEGTGIDDDSDEDYEFHFDTLVPEDQTEDIEVEKEVAALPSSFAPPLFVRVECTEYTSQTKSYSCHTGFTQSILSSTGWANYRETFDDTIGDIASTKLSEKRTALRIVAHTLPNEKAYEVSQHGGSEFLDITFNDQEPLQLLPVAYRHVIKVLRKRLKLFSQMEVLYQLLSIQEMTSPLMKLVESLLSNSAISNGFKLPLQFLRSSPSAIESFKRELLSSRHLNLERIDDIYYISDRRNGSLRYWALIRIKQQIKVKVSVVIPPGPETERLHILTSLRLGILNALHRVNQQILLAELNETRICSPYLLRPSNGDDDTAATAGSDEFTTSMLCWTGQFECPLQLTFEFDLHERLTPSIALNTLCSNALQHFQVHNRRRVFVYSDKSGSIFYLKLFKSNDLMKIFVNIYGIEAPDEEITTSLRRILERKLDEATQLILSKLLSRNLNFQLLASDIAFLQPNPTQYDHVACFVLPEGNTFDLLQQNLLRFSYIHVTRIIDTIGYHPSYLGSIDDATTTNDAAMVSPVVFFRKKKPTAAAFLFDLTSELRLSPGKGLLYIIIDQNSCASDEAVVHDLSNPNDKTSTLRVRIWTRSSIDMKQFVELLRTMIRQSLVEHVLEDYMNDLDQNTYPLVQINSILTVFKQAEELEFSSVVTHVSYQLHLPLYDLAKVLTELVPSCQFQGVQVYVKSMTGQTYEAYDGSRIKSNDPVFVIVGYNKFCHVTLSKAGVEAWFYKTPLNDIESFRADASRILSWCMFRYELLQCVLLGKTNQVYLRPTELTTVTIPTESFPLTSEALDAIVSTPVCPPTFDLLRSSKVSEVPQIGGILKAESKHSKSEPIVGKQRSQVVATNAVAFARARARSRGNKQTSKPSAVPVSAPNAPWNTSMAKAAPPPPVRKGKPLYLPHDYRYVEIDVTEPDLVRRHGVQFQKMMDKSNKCTAERQACVDMIRKRHEPIDERRWNQLRRYLRVILHRRMPFLPSRPLIASESIADPSPEATDFLLLLEYEGSYSFKRVSHSVSSLYAEYTRYEQAGDKVRVSDFFQKLQSTENPSTNQHAFIDVYSAYLQRNGFSLLSDTMLFGKYIPEDQVHLVLQVDFNGTSVGVTMYCADLDQIRQVEYDYDDVPHLSTTKSVYWGQCALNLYTWVYDYTIQDIHFFLQNATGYRSILFQLNTLLEQCPVPPDDARHAIGSVFLKLEANRILLRYIACHSERYAGVYDLFQHGNPDAFCICPFKTPECSVVVMSVDNTTARLILLKLELNSFEDVAFQAREYVISVFEQANVDFRRDILWARLLRRHLSSPGLVEVQIEELEECLRLSSCTALTQIDPCLKELLETAINWEEFLWQIAEVYRSQLCEYQFGDAYHALLLCPTAQDLMIHIQLHDNRLKVDICRRETTIKPFTSDQREVIGEFVNCLCHWLWRNLNVS